MEELGAYVLETELSRGAMGRIHRAHRRDDPARAPVAVKRLVPSLAAQPEFREMLADEVHVLRQMDHPGIVRVLAFHRAPEAFLVMDHHPGVPLQAALDAGRVSPPLALHVAAELARGLDHVHTRRAPDGSPLNAVHRSVGAETAWLGHDGVVRMMDFGVARAEGRATVTPAGVIKGLLHALSPEAVRGEVLDGRADVFALGALVYEMLAGRRPFTGEHDLDTLRRCRESRWDRLEDVLPALRGVDALLARLLAAPREMRCTAAEAARALEALAAARGWTAGPADVAALARDLAPEPAPAADVDALDDAVVAASAGRGR